MIPKRRDSRIAMHMLLQPARSIFRATLLLCGLCCASTGAQSTIATLPDNYKTIFENQDLLVMHVHYGAHEFVPMHDHSAYPTVYVYLNNSGEVAIAHEGPEGLKVVRPPTHAGAFRIGPSMAERHSVTNLGDTASDFLRVELKSIPLSDLEEVFRGEAPSPPSPGTHTEFEDAALRIDRVVCPANSPCSATPATARSLLVAITPQQIETKAGKRSLKVGDVFWFSGNDDKALRLSAGAQNLRITLLYPE
jgi:hypothetical protein